MPTLPTHGAHCIYRPALARLLSSCGALRWSWSCPAQVVHPGLVPALHCQPLVTALVPALLCHSQHAALAHHSPLQEKTLHSGHAQDCCGCRLSRCHSRTPHTYILLWSPGIGTAGPWTVDGGWWTPFGTGNTPSRDNLPTCQLNTHTTFQTLSDY